MFVILGNSLGNIPKSFDIMLYKRRMNEMSFSSEVSIWYGKRLAGMSLAILYICKRKCSIQRFKKLLVSNQLCKEYFRWSQVNLHFKFHECCSRRNWMINTNRVIPFELNSLTANPTFVLNSPGVVWVCLTIFMGLVLEWLSNVEACSEPYKISMISYFVKIVNACKLIAKKLRHTCLIGSEMWHCSKKATTIATMTFNRSKPPREFSFANQSFYETITFKVLTIVLCDNVARWSIDYLCD